MNDVQRTGSSVPCWCTLADKLVLSQTSEIGSLPAWSRVLFQSVCQAWGIAPVPLMSQSPFITSSGCGGGGRTSCGGLLKCAEERINGISRIKNPLGGGLKAGGRWKGRGWALGVVNSSPVSAANCLDWCPSVALSQRTGRYRAEPLWRAWPRRGWGAGGGARWCRYICSAQVNSHRHRLH